ncbi:hypothetical protein PACTADRAFT_49399 [Pachysolen tannophilus NRRL Y-2460]|uniref:Uncharacterized protein n=1 Tax=Pachysolen tannophilus NRRL Y-2460 TaxID=669874 RepID=A0A1E4TW09_PACTA|nr:hypothetical protein PACTADRAFT_49399 [Pachysolen tannophilus NRRL Y-2460]
MRSLSFQRSFNSFSKVWKSSSKNTKDIIDHKFTHIRKDIQHDSLTDLLLDINKTANILHNPSDVRGYSRPKASVVSKEPGEIFHKLSGVFDHLIEKDTFTHNNVNNTSTSTLSALQKGIQSSNVSQENNSSIAKTVTKMKLSDFSDPSSNPHLNPELKITSTNTTIISETTHSKRQLHDLDKKNRLVSKKIDDHQVFTSNAFVKNEQNSQINNNQKKKRKPPKNKTYVRNLDASSNTTTTNNKDDVPSDDVRLLLSLLDRK